jgi:hypothetical protein
VSDVQTGTVTARGRTLQLLRAAYGTALVLAPGRTIRLATGRIPSRRTCRVAQLLGARHLAQTALTAVAPRPAVFAAGGQVDAVHAASMLLLAAADNSARRAALADALTEGVFAAAGLWASAHAGQGCRLRARPYPAAARTLSCQSAQEPPGHGS